jgi:hypothetical protein
VLTLTSYFAFVIILYPVLKLPVVLRLFAMKDTPESIARINFRPSAISNNVPAFGEGVATQALVTML